MWEKNTGGTIMINLFSYPFMVRAMIVGVIIAGCAALIGPFIVLRRQSMIGDGLAHVSFAAVAISLLLGNQPLLFSVPIVVLSSFFILKLSESKHWDGDAAIAMVSSFSIALGVLISSVNQGFSVDLYSYLFGSLLVIRTYEVYLSIVLGLVCLVLVYLYYQDLVSITYDEEFSKAHGIKVKRLNQLLAVLTSITVVLGIRMVGTMLISALIIFPSVTALRVSRSFSGLLRHAVLISIISVIIGVIGSFYLNFPTGASIVLVNAVIFLLLQVMIKVID